MGGGEGADCLGVELRITIGWMDYLPELNGSLLGAALFPLSVCHRFSLKIAVASSLNPNCN